MTKNVWKKYQRLSVLFFGTAFFGILHNPAAFAETLEEALASAYRNNPALEAERASLRATDEQVPQALSGWRPTITGEGSFGTRISDNTSSTVPGIKKRETIDPLNASVSIRQNIFNGGQTLFGTREARQSVQSGRETLRNTEQTTLLNAVRAYMNVLRDVAIVNLRRKNVQVLERQLEASRDRFEVGEITRTDVAQSEARLSLSQTNLIAAEAQLTSSRANYVRVIGNAPGSLRTPGALPELPQSEQDALELARSRNPGLLAARHAEKAARNAVSRAKGGLLPSLSVDASYQYAEDPSGALSEQELRTVTGRINVPLYQGGGQHSRIRQARQRYMQNRLLVADRLRQVDEGVKNAWDSLKSARAAIDSRTQQVLANEIALEGVRQEEQVGSRTTIDVLNAEQELLDAQVQLVGAQSNEYVAGYTLLAATGNLGARQLGLNVEYYDPAANFDAVENKWIGFGVLDDE